MSKESLNLAKDELLPELPPSHAGHGYTRLSVAALRRNTQKMPTLSGVADHLEALGGEVAGWEARARHLHEVGQALYARSQELERTSEERAALADGMIEDFSSQRQALEEEITTLSGVVSGLTEKLATANTSLEVMGADHAALLAELSSFKGFHERLVADMDSNEARLMAQVSRTQEDLEVADGRVSDAIEQHEEDVSVASTVIADLLGRLGLVSEDLAKAYVELAASDVQVEALRGELQGRVADHALAFQTQTQELSVAQLRCETLAEDLVQAREKLAQSDDLFSLASKELEEETRHRQDVEEKYQDALRRADSLVQDLNQERAAFSASRELIQQQDDMLRGSRAELDAALARAAATEATLREELSAINEDLRSRLGVEEGLRVSLSLLAAQVDREAELRVQAEAHASHVPSLESALLEARGQSQELDRRLSDTLVSLEGARQEVVRVSADLLAAQELLEEEAAIRAADRDRHAQESEGLAEAQAARTQAEELMFEERAALVLSQQEVSRLTSALSEACQGRDALRREADRAAELDVQVSALHELLRAQAAELDRVESERRAQALAAAGYDDSIPWPLRAWTPGASPRFIPVPEVSDWLVKSGWTAVDLGPARFPGYSAADREHLAMASGMPVDQFLSLPFVRPCIKKQVEDQLAAGSTPSSVEGEWIMVDGAPHWRVNRLWRHLIAVSEARAPQAWDHYVKGELLGV